MVASPVIINVSVRARRLPASCILFLRFNSKARIIDIMPIARTPASLDQPSQTRNIDKYPIPIKINNDVQKSTILMVELLASGPVKYKLFGSSIEIHPGIRLRNTKDTLLDNMLNTIIIRPALYLRWCWNWQTGTLEVRVS
jgi:hypothetical protein